MFYPGDVEVVAVLRMLPPAESNLLQESPDYSKFYEQAKKIASDNPGSEFADEFSLLEELTED